MGLEGERARSFRVDAQDLRPERRPSRGARGRTPWARIAARSRPGSPAHPKRASRRRRAPAARCAQPVCPPDKGRARSASELASLTTPPRPRMDASSPVGGSARAARARNPPRSPPMGCTRVNLPTRPRSPAPAPGAGLLSTRVASGRGARRRSVEDHGQREPHEQAPRDAHAGREIGARLVADDVEADLPRGGIAEHEGTVGVRGPEARAPLARVRGRGGLEVDAGPGVDRGANPRRSADGCAAASGATDAASSEDRAMALGRMAGGD